MDGTMPRSYCCQYREPDLDFVRRILTEEDLSWRFEQNDDGPGAVLFADSSQLSAMPDDASSEADGGIRYHGVRLGERQDTVQALIAQRRLHATLATVLSPDYKAKQIVAASSPSRIQNRRSLPALESYDVPGQYAYANSAQAQRYADLQMQAKEARSLLWHGRSTVRTLRAGTRRTVAGTPLQQLGDTPAFAIISVTSVGVNNLPPPAQQALVELFGPITELLQETVRGNEPDDLALVIAQATESGYANCFGAIPAAVTWRPQLTETSFWEVRCAQHDSAGDGTVPARSGCEPRQSGGRSILQQFELTGIQHEPAYRDYPVAQRVTYYAVTKLGKR